MTSQTTINEDGEIETGTALVEVSQTVALARAEIDQQVTTAKAYPRSPAKAAKALLEIVQLDKESASEAMYALPVDGKPITGPSIRFAEALFSTWGNASVAARVTEVNRVDQFVEAEAVFWDLETNARKSARARRSIRGKNGRTYPERMIVTTCSAAMSIATREAITKGIPKPVWSPAYQSVLATIKGDVKTLSERRSKAIAIFAQWGVSAERIYEKLGVKGLEDIGLDDLPNLLAMYQSIKNGEATVEDYFSKAAPNEVVRSPLDDEASDAAQDQRQSNAPAPKAPADEAPANGPAVVGEAAPGKASAKATEDGAARSDQVSREAERAPSTDHETERRPQTPSGRQSEGAGTTAGAAEPAEGPAPTVSSTLVHTPAPPSTSVHTDVEVEQASIAGARAYRKGLPKRAMPVAYGTSGVLADAWRAAYDTAKATDAEG